MSPGDEDDVPGDLLQALERQRRRDVLGPDPVAAQVDHSRGFAAVVADISPGRVVDLGSGGGLPGLVLAVVSWPQAEVVLVDASQRRCTYLELEVGRLGLGPRVQVRWTRAEELGRDPDWRGQADLVVARSFGPPATVAECAAPLLQVGGSVVVSDPPEGAGDRWPDEGLALVGLAREATTEVGGAHYARLRAVQPCSDRYPRRPGLPAQRPLF